MKLDQHIMPFGDKWAVKGEGNNRFTSIHDTEIEAIVNASKITRILGSSLYIHRK
jgi:hypothetical protein